MLTTAFLWHRLPQVFCFVLLLSETASLTQLELAAWAGLADQCASLERQAYATTASFFLTRVAEMNWKPVLSGSLPGPPPCWPSNSHSVNRNCWFVCFLTTVRNNSRQIVPDMRSTAPPCGENWNSSAGLCNSWLRAQGCREASAAYR